MAETDKIRFEIPDKIKFEIIKNLKLLILKLKSNYEVYSFVQLKSLLYKSPYNGYLDNLLKNILRQYQNRINLDWLKNHFNIVLAIMDYLMGGNLTAIATEFNHSRRYIRNIARIIISDKSEYAIRFNPFGTRNAGIREHFVKSYAECVINKKLTPENFKNLLNEQLQALKSYYKRKFNLANRKKLISLFMNYKIQPEFISWIYGLNNSEYESVYKELFLDDIKKDAVIGICETVNKQNEILKYIIYSLIENINLNPMMIAKSAGISYDRVRDIGNILSKNVNPVTKSSFLNYDERFSFKYKNFTGASKRIHPTYNKYMTILPSKEQDDIISELTKLIEKFHNKYNTEYKLRDLLNSNFNYFTNQVENDLIKNQQEIFENLKRISIKHPRADFDFVLSFLRIIIDIKDCLFGGDIASISKRYKTGFHYIRTIARKIISDNSIYNKRFYNPRNSQQMLLCTADNIFNDVINEKSFEHLINPQFQDLMNEFRKKEGIKRGYALFKSRSFLIDPMFGNWIRNLPKDKLTNVLEGYHSIMNKEEILNLCYDINKNLEILKYIIYSIINSTDNLTEISEVAGKSVGSVQRAARSLASNYSKTTNKFYLLDYKRRFSKN